MTGQGPAPVLGAAARAVRRDLTGAADHQVLKVLRYVEQLPDRGAADGLLAPLRDRLRRLRPPRKLRFARLLCMPLDPAVVDPRDWHAGTPQFPRSAITPIAVMVRRLLPNLAATVQSIIDDPELPDAGRVEKAGALLWSEAASALQSAPVPPEWHAAGIPAASFAPLAQACALCLRSAIRIDLMGDPGIPELELNQSLAAMLTAAEPDGTIAWGMLLTALLQRFPQAEAPLRAATAMRANRSARQAGETALEAGFHWIERCAGDLELGLAHIADAASELNRQITFLSLMAEDPKQHRRAASLQSELHTASARRLDAALQERVVEPLHDLAAAGDVTDAAIEKLESDARGLRRFECEIRRIAPGAATASGLKPALAAVAACAALDPIDRARLTEILHGPQLPRPV